MVLSLEAETMVLPSGLNDTSLIPALSPVSVVRKVPLIFQSLMVSFSVTEAINLPSGLNETSFTPSA